jgi:CHASE3 domain sensor protein
MARKLLQKIQALGDPHSHESHVRNERSLLAKLSAAQVEVKVERARREQAEVELAQANSQLEAMLYTSDKINPRTIERLKKHGGGWGGWRAWKGEGWGWPVAFRQRPNDRHG